MVLKRFCWLTLVSAGLFACEATPSPAVGPISAASAVHEAMVVATIHKGHLLQAGYPLTVLRRLVEAYRPDLILVEIRPAPFAAGHYEDGPFEMTYVIDAAARARIPVEPIDWWREEELAQEPPLDTADQRSLDDALRKLQEPLWPSFELANSPAERARTLRELNAYARYAAGNPLWSRRQAWFHERALAAIEKHGARRTLAFVGATHRPELEGFLQGTGIRVVEPLSVSLPPAPSEEGVPESVVGKWREGIGRLQTAAESLTGDQRRRLDDKIRYFSVAVERKGRCCVEEANLTAPKQATNAEHIDEKLEVPRLSASVRVPAPRGIHVRTIELSDGWTTEQP
jgi:hypothetical protein